MNEKYRVQFDFTPEAYRELENLKAALGAGSRAEVIRYALRVLQWLLAQLSSGSEIVVEKGGQQQQVVFPFLKVSQPIEKTLIQSTKKAVAHAEANVKA